jgi:Lipocalin-like domain
MFVRRHRPKSQRAPRQGDRHGPAGSDHGRGFRHLPEDGTGLRRQQQTLTHSMFVSFFPNWTGQTQPLVVELDGDMLRLSTAFPIESSRQTVMSYLQWRRASN